jgi:hypothetical protein
VRVFVKTTRLVSTEVGADSVETVVAVKVVGWTRVVVHVAGGLALVVGGRCVVAGEDEATDVLEGSSSELVATRALVAEAN